MGSPLAKLSTYELRHLAAHLDGAGRTDDLHRLLALETDEQRNAWYEAKEAIDDSAGFTTDIGLAWQSAENAYATGAHTGQSLGLQIRYTLITSSLNSIAQNIPPTMIGALVKQKVWSLDRAMTYIRRIADLELRADAMSELLPLLDASRREDWFSEALVSARAIQYELYYTKKLSKLVNSFPDPKPQSVLCAFFAEIMGLVDTSLQVQYLVQMANDLPDDLVLKALSRVRATLEKSDCGNLRFARRLVEPLRGEMITETLAAARKTGDAFVLAQALSQLRKQLWSPEYEPLLHEALSLARSQKNGLALMDLVPLLSGNEQEQALQYLLSMLNYSGDEGEFLLLIDSAPQLPDSLRVEFLSELLVAARKIEDEYSRFRALTRLAPYFVGEQQDNILKEVVAAANSWENSSMCDELGKLVPLMSPSLLRETLTSAGSSSNMRWRAGALAALGHATSLPEPERDDGLRAALKAIQDLRQTGDLSYAHQALQTLTPFLPPSLLKEALRALQTIGDDLSQIENLELIFPHLPEAEKKQAWRMVVTATAGSDKEWPRTEKVRQLAQYLPGSLYVEVIELAQRLKKPQLRAIALAGLAPSLSVDDRESVLADALASAERIVDPWSKANALIAVLQVLSLSERQRIVQEVLSTANQMKDGSDQVRIFIDLIPFLSDAQREKVLLLGIESARLASSGRKSALAILAPVLPEALVYKILYGAGYSLRLSDIKSIAQAPDKLEREHRNAEMEQKESGSMPYAAFMDYRHEAFPVLITRLAELGSVDDAYIALGDLDQYDRAAALAGLAAYLPESLVRVEWQAALQMTRAPEREHVLASLSARIAELGDWNEALHQARRIEDRQWQARALLWISVHLEMEAQKQVLREAWDLTQLIEDASQRKESIEALISQMAKLPQVMLQRLCPQLLISLSRHIRQEQIPELYILTPVFVAVGGAESVLACYHALQEVRRWWP